MPIKIDFISNVTSFLRGTKDTEQALEDVADSLDDVVRDGDRATEKLERGFRDLARQAEKTEDSVKDVGEKGFKAAGENVSNFKDEAVQNFSEVASSFSGNVEDMASGVQGLTGGLASALTPGIGIPIAILGAAAAVFLENWRKSAEESEERISSMYDDMLESGEGFLSAQFLQQGIATIFGDPEKIKLAEERAKSLGATTETVARAMAGDQNAINQLLGDRAQMHEEEIGLLVKQSDGSRDAAAAIQKENREFETKYGWMVDINGEYQTAQGRARSAGKAQSDALKATINSAKTATREVDALGNELYTLPDGEQILIDAETGQATTDIKKFKGDVDKIPESVTSTVKVKVDDSAWRKWVPQTKMGAVAASPQQQRAERWGKDVWS